MILARNLKNRGVEIEPLDLDPKEQVSVDLTVGDHYQVSGEKEWRSLESEIVISPGSSLLIRTKETFNMPNNVFGLLSSKGSLAAKGIIVANTKIDPLFEGHLNIPVFNVSSKKLRMKKDSKYCSIAFWPTEHPVTGIKTIHAIKMQTKDSNAIADFFSNNIPHFITGILSVVGAVIAAIITSGGGV
ncbi:hypothetical protein [Neptuniibacter sp. 2_MG-2023]|uniref:dCTP deaminase n=1 Tax=Neptuniibacter sp. 2_MG-2023 TaxID=3062671 RepID=UPI0026E429F1|nr:hypothetical protein [Neptuniibacter sp. 2_MG-2023]MDO6514479.1 hypothetical protein [Neptuniibacter sp. 2_MG-2023]